jgi:hypothetical protein
MHAKNQKGAFQEPEKIWGTSNIEWGNRGWKPLEAAGPAYRGF